VKKYPTRLLKLYQNHNSINPSRITKDIAFQTIEVEFSNPNKLIPTQPIIHISKMDMTIWLNPNIHQWLNDINIQYTLWLTNKQKFNSMNCSWYSIIKNIKIIFNSSEELILFRLVWINSM
jgi:hypothetical protein